MKKNKFLAVAYGILPIATVSISPSSFAEEQRRLMLKVN